MSGSIRGRPDEEFSIEESDSERIRKRGKKEHELKADDVAQNVLSEEDEPITTKPIPTLKRERDDEVALSSTKKTKDKTTEIKQRIIPYRSHFPKETDLLIKKIPDIATQNRIKKEADELFKTVTDQSVREEIIKLTIDIPPDEKAAFLEHVGFYLESYPKSLEILAKIEPNQRVGLMTEFKDLLSFVDDRKTWIITIFEHMPREGLLESVVLVKSLLSDVSSHKDEEVIETLLYAIGGIANQKKGDLFNQLKPALQGITNGRILAGILKGIYEAVKSNRDLTPAQLEQSIKDAKPFLNAVAEPLEKQFKSEIIEHLSTLFLILTTIPTEKRSELIEKAVYLSTTSADFIYAITDGETLSTITKEQLDKAIVQTKNFLKNFHIDEDNDTLDIFLAFAKMPSDQYKNVVENAKPLLEEGKTYNTAKTLDIIANAAPYRERLIKEVESLAKFVYSNTPSAKRQILIALSKIPADKIWSVRAQIEPLLKSPVSEVTLQSLLEFTANQPQAEADLFIQRCATFMDMFNDSLSLGATFILKKIAEIETEDWDKLLQQSSRIIELLDKEIWFDSTAADILKAVAKIAPEKREDVITRAIPLLSINKTEIKNNVKQVLRDLEIIPPEEYDDIVASAKQLLEEYEYDGGEFAYMLLSIYSIDPAERALVIGSALADIDDETTIGDISEYIDYYGAYSLELTEEDIKERPVELLAQFADQISKKRANRVKVTFQGEKGEDAGGLARSFIAKLFKALPEELGLEARPNGLYTPIETEPLSDERKKVYNDIGRVLMFCINATTDYPIGMIFELPVFTALVKLNENHLKRPIQELVENKQAFDELCDMYLEMHRLDESQQNTLKWIQENKNSPDARETIQGMMIELFGPLIEIAKGMRGTSFTRVTAKDVQEEDPQELSELIQGKVDAEMIKESLEFGDDVPQNLTEWVREWIDDADETKLSQFLVAMSGSPALGKMPLKITKCEGELTLFHTCFNHVELPVNILDTQEKLNTNLDANLGGGKFTMA